MTGRAPEPGAVALDDRPDPTDEPDAAPADGIGRLTALLDRASGLLTDLSPATFVIGLGLVTVLRSGIGTYGREMGNWAVLSRSFPDPLPNWRTNTVLGPALGRAVGVETSSDWIALHAVLTAVVLGVVLVVVRGRFATTVARRVAASWLALASVAPSLLQKIGTYDVFTVAGSVLVVWGRRRWAAVVGGVLMGATSAEQGALGLVAAIAVLAVVADPGEPRLGPAIAAARRSPVVARIALGLGALVATRALVVIWIARSGIDAPSRGDVLRTWFVESIVKSVGASAGGLYAFFGAAWALIGLVWLLSRWSKLRLGVLGIAVIGVPAVVSMTTLDGTRVFAMVSLPALLVLVAWVAEQAEDGPHAVLVRRLTTAVLLASLVLPALITDPNGRDAFSYPWPT